uniref:Uncharacterized protein n=1 Tax=Anguilla anguilla TaxID=7936 RepID=A0A0E9U1I5_ANGAN
MHEPFKCIHRQTQTYLLAVHQKSMMTMVVWGK